ncbi:hypothetical protein TorRG33x02_128020 [Trema orientale]|uniref:Uncharacterized protein n=1 Tax=Trema orientale TaxID=63057 RepID=A0A2P5F171_TREOI|nr:hypothetical protein TorRG33x02_128020 [Trema orientale]
MDFEPRALWLFQSNPSVFNVLHPFKLMVSALINEYLIPETCEPVFELVKKLERRIGLDIVVSTCLLNNPIAGSFG